GDSPRQQFTRADACQRHDHGIEQDERQEEVPPVVALLRQTAKDEAERNADELHQQQRQQQFNRAKPQLRAVNRRQSNNRADAIVVNQKRDQKAKQLAEAANVAQRRA